MPFDLSQPFAIIADIHGNSDALSAVLDDIDRAGVRQIINLGDHFSGPLAARETADILLARPMETIRGNHDRVLITQAPDTMHASDRAAHDQLDRTHLAWIEALQTSLTIADDVFACHGTPQSDTTYWLEDVLPDGQIISRPRYEVEAFASGTTSPLLLCGHTHIPRGVRLTDGRMIVNPGSVGLPAYDDDQPHYHVMQTGTPHACYATAQRRDGKFHVSFKQVPYDTQRMVELAKAAGRKDWAKALETGWLEGG